MLEFLQRLISPESYVPHGHCYLWQTPLVTLHVLSDGLIAIAYFSIPILLIYFVRQRQDIPFSRVFVLFSLFILFCGIGHALEIWTLWHPAYWVSGVEKAITALVSCYTALALVELFPQFLALKSPEELRRINQELEAQIAERMRVEALLESRVDERTAALVQANTALASEIQERTAIQSDLQQMAKQERAMALVLQRMRQSLDLTVIFQVTTEELRQVMECDRTLIYRFNPDWSGDVIAESVGTEWQTILQSFQPDEADLTSMVNRETCVAKQLKELEILREDTYLKETQGGIYQKPTSYCCVPDVLTAGFDDCYLQLLAVLQARAYIIVPIFCRKQLWGLLAAYQNGHPRHWLASEIQVMTRIGGQLGVAVQQAELFNQVQQQAEDLQVAKEQADQASRAKGTFLATVSHELRTPLNVILGLTQVLSREPSLANPQQQYLETISRSGEHLLALIDDVLEMSKIEAGQVPLHEECFSLAHLLDSLESMMRVRAAAKGLNLSFAWETMTLPPQITTDRRKLNQILINLLGNAIKFTQQGRVGLRVACYPPESAQSNLCTLVFAIEDTGPGIAGDDIPYLFKPFYQTHVGQKNTEGTGLGLAISQHYAQLLGGEISVQSQSDRGSTFILTIQATVDDVSPLPRPVSLQGQVIGLAPGQPNRRILVVEDHPVNRLLLVKILDLPGFEVQEADNGEAAIALWHTWHPDLVLMDIQMPDMNGYEATRRIRQREQAEAQDHCTPIIAVTASAFEDQQQEALDSGCNAVITKPFKSNQIFEKIAQFLSVQYIYEAASPPADTLEQRGPLPTLDAELLSGMPLAWVARLHQAACQGNDLWIAELLMDIPADQQVLDQVLNHLIQEFQFEAITTVTEGVLGSKAP